MIELSLFSRPATAPRCRFLSDIANFCHHHYRNVSVCQMSASTTGRPLIYFANLLPKKSLSFQVGLASFSATAWPIRTLARANRKAIQEVSALSDRKRATTYQPAWHRPRSPS